MKLQGRRILISGAASGIGTATAKLFLEEGAALALLDRDAGGLSRVKTEMSATADDRVLTAECDVTDAHAVEHAITKVGQELGGLDGLVLSAGIDLLKPFDQMSGADWQHVLNVNLTGPFHICRAAMPFLKEADAATIIHIASGAGLRPLEHRTAYCTSKAGLVMFAKALAIDLAPYGVRVNAICPGAIDTPLFRQSTDGQEDEGAALAKIMDRYLIKRPGQPEDIAKAALFLSSADSTHVTGTALSVDGGRAFH